jgi:hypothetical protein
VGARVIITEQHATGKKKDEAEDIKVGLTSLLTMLTEMRPRPTTATATTIGTTSPPSPFPTTTNLLVRMLGALLCRGDVND